MRYLRDTNCWFSIVVLVFSLMTSVAMIRRGVAEESAHNRSGWNRPPLNKEQRELWRACMSGKGFTLPSREQSEAGTRPELSDEQKESFRAVAKDCRTQALASKSVVPTTSILN
jgi:hypothetical protein